MSNRANTSVLIIIHTQPHTHTTARTHIGIPLLTLFIEGQTFGGSNFISEVRVFILKWKVEGQAFKKKRMIFEKWVRIYITSSKMKYHVDLLFLRVSWIYRCHRSHIKQRFFNLPRLVKKI